MKFQVGDEVRVVKAMSPNKSDMEPYVGRRGVVVIVMQGGPPYRYYVGLTAGMKHIYCRAGELELIPKAKRRPGKK
jgi:hypothetical protein